MAQFDSVLNILQNFLPHPEGAGLSEILRFSEECQKELGSLPPSDYLDFLKIHNGLAENGVFLYSTYRTPLLDGSGQNLGFVEVNLNWRDLEWMKDYLILGDSDMDIYVFEKRSGVFQVRDRQVFDKVYDEFSSFSELLEHMVNLMDC
ncbi:MULTISPECIES: YrhA family protein [Pseudomonas]|uniref:SMI1/KNR4 family protein n=1 Tax=Pseudomonas quercus TaxID=2722792 RepID=A0ABX0YDA2_9PSED|nr:MULTISPECIES: YrhA family protein [Pseudomonas]MBF7142719.1 SMI1/KNR4 family protein [Pseudomonas sp. LY10J]NJP01257.1 SMI1/KNR4 family protein [Pseudomonas quercus]